MRGRSRAFGPAVYGVSSAETVSATDVALVDQYLDEVAIDLDFTAPAAAADCTGGGTVVASTDPAAGASLATITSPVIYCTIQTDGGELRYGYGDIGVGTTHIGARLLSMSPIVRALSDLHGNWETGRCTIRLVDHDRALRALKATGELRNKRVDVYAISLADLAAGNAPWRLGQFVIRKFFAHPGLEFSLECEDYFGSSVSEFALGKLIPQRTFTTTDFPAIASELQADNYSPGNPTLVGKAVPIIYGSVSDESDGDDAIGSVPCHYVGMRQLSGDYAAELWYEFVLCGHAIKKVQSVFAAENTIRQRERMPASTNGVDMLWPDLTNTGWTGRFGSVLYRDFNGRRYTCLYARGPRGLAAAEGKIPITANVCGIESTGDGTGTLIDSGPLQVQHLLSNFVLQNYANGNWSAIPTVNSYSRIHSSSFASAKTASEARVTGGYLGAFVLGHDGSQQALRDLVKDLCLSFDLRLGVNRHGQIIGSLQTPAAATALTLTDVNDIIDRTFEPNVKFEDVYNRVLYRYKRRYTKPITQPTPEPEELLPSGLRAETPDWFHDNQETADGPSIAALSETKTFDLSLKMVREATTADDVAETIKLRQLDPVWAPLKTDLRGTAVELGQLIALTHFEGLTATGYSGATFEVARLVIDPNPSQVTVELEGQNVSDL